MSTSSFTLPTASSGSRMPSSSHSVSMNSRAFMRGLRISAISALSGCFASSERMMVVLPVPTSPVSWMKPPASVMP